MHPQASWLKQVQPRLESGLPDNFRDNGLQGRLGERLPVRAASQDC